MTNQLKNPMTTTANSTNILPQTEAGMLADENAIISAVKRSISHNEIVSIPDESPMMTVDWIADIYDDVDSASEPDGSRDVWGKRDGEDFRIKLVKQ